MINIDRRKRNDTRDGNCVNAIITMYFLRIFYIFQIQFGFNILYYNNNISSNLYRGTQYFPWQFLHFYSRVEDDKDLDKRIDCFSIAHNARLKILSRRS